MQLKYKWKPISFNLYVLIFWAIFWQANSFSVIRKILRLVWYSKFCYSVHWLFTEYKIRFISCIFKIHSPSIKLISFKWPFLGSKFCSQRFKILNFVCCLICVSCISACEKYGVWLHAKLLFGRCSVLNPAKTPAIMTKGFLCFFCTSCHISG